MLTLRRRMGDALNFKTPNQFLVEVAESGVVQHAVISSVHGRYRGQVRILLQAQAQGTGGPPRSDNETPEARTLCAADQHLCCVVRPALH